MPMKPVTCDACSQQFRPAIVTERATGFVESVFSPRPLIGGEIWYFACPHCGRRYDVCHISRHGVELRRQMESVRSQLRHVPTRGPVADELERLVKEFEAEVTGLANPMNRGDNDSGLTSA